MIFDSLLPIILPVSLYSTAKTVLRTDILSHSPQTSISHKNQPSQTIHHNICPQSKCASPSDSWLARQSKEAQRTSHHALSPKEADNTFHAFIPFFQPWLSSLIPCRRGRSKQYMYSRLGRWRQCLGSVGCYLLPSFCWRMCYVYGMEVFSERWMYTGC